MKEKIHTSLVIAWVVFTMVASAQIQSMDQIQAAYEKEWDANIQKVGEELTRLSSQYESALGRLLEAQRQAGELDGVLAAQREAARFAASKKVEHADLVSELPELRKMQETFRLTSARISGEAAGLRLRMANQLEASLEKLQTALTRENAIEEALNVRNYRANLSQSPHLTQARTEWDAWQTLASSAAPAPTPVAPTFAPSAVTPRPTITVAEPLGNEISAIKRRYKQFYKALADKDPNSAIGYVDPEQVRIEGVALMNVRLNILGSWIAAAEAAGGKPDTDKVVISEDRTTAVATHTTESSRVRFDRADEMQWVKRNGEWFILLKERRAGEANPPRRPPPPRAP